MMMVLHTDTTTNWQVGKSALECSQYIFEKQLWCDITINVHSPDGSVTTIRAHKTTLRSRSPMFEAMLGGNFTESSGDTVNLKDTDPIAFKNVIRYMYCDNAEITVDKVLSIRNLAKMYILQGLEDLCVQFINEQMRKQLTVDSVCAVLIQAVELCQDDAVDQCLGFCSGNDFLEVINSEPFMNLPNNVLLRFVQFNELPAMYEAELLHACTAWGKRRQETTGEDIRTALGKIVFEIKYHQLSPPIFTRIIDEDSQLLTDQEKLRLFYVMNSADRIHKEKLAQIGFNIHPRVTEWRRSVDRNWHDPEGSLCAYNSSEVLVIKPKRHLMLQGFGVFSGTRGKEHKLEFTVTCEQGIMQQYPHRQSFETAFVSEDPLMIHPVYLKSPFRLTPGVEYTIKLKPPPDRLCFFKASEESFRMRSGDVIESTTSMFGRPCEVKTPPDNAGWSREWLLSYLHTLFTSPVI